MFRCKPNTDARVGKTEPDLDATTTLGSTAMDFRLISSNAANSIYGKFPLDVVCTDRFPGRYQRIFRDFHPLRQLYIEVEEVDERCPIVADQPIEGAYRYAPLLIAHLVSQNETKIVETRTFEPERNKNLIGSWEQEEVLSY